MIKKLLRRCRVGWCLHTIVYDGMCHKHNRESLQERYYQEWLKRRFK